MNAEELSNLSDVEFYDARLYPVYMRYRKTKYKGLKLAIQEFKNPLELGWHYCEYMIEGSKIKWIGLDGGELRVAENQDVERILQFMHLAATDGRKAYHPSCWQYLLGQVTQVAIKNGFRPGFDSMMKREHWRADDALGVQGLIRSEFDTNLADDKDRAKVASTPSALVQGLKEPASPAPKPLVGLDGKPLSSQSPQGASHD